MKILHLGDIHLGRYISGLSLLEDQKYIFQQILNLCDEEQIKYIVISGDVYDRSVPGEDAVKALNDFLSSAVIDHKIKVYIVSGNHDGRERLSCFSDLLMKTGLVIDGDINKDLTMKKYEIKEDNLSINIYSLPYLFPSYIRSLSSDDSIKTFEDSIKKVLEANPLNKEEINILNTHYFVSHNGEVIRSDSETKTSVGTIEEVSYETFKDFDYVALGHLHCPQWMGRKSVRYAGSPLRYSVDEIKQNKTFTIINIKGKEDIEIIEKEIKPLHQFIDMSGTVEELTQNPDDKVYDYVYFRLQETTPVLNAAARLKIKYLNYVGLEYTHLESILKDPSDVDKSVGFNDLPMNEQFAEFFKKCLKKDLNEQQKQVIDEIAKELEDR